MDTITYNIGSKKAKIKGVATQEGDGWLIGNNVKKMDDNTIHIQDGKYTTCDQTDHPHFYLAMTKAKVIPGKKVVTGPAYLVLEDVPIYFPLLPEGFFPLSSGPQVGSADADFRRGIDQGILHPRPGLLLHARRAHGPGHPGRYLHPRIVGGIRDVALYEALQVQRHPRISTTRTSVSATRANPTILQQNNFQHLLDSIRKTPKPIRDSTFSASVELPLPAATTRYSATSLNEALQPRRPSSTISYSKSWRGTPFSLSANMSVSQNSQSGTHLDRPAERSSSTFRPSTPSNARRRPASTAGTRRFRCRYTGKIDQHGQRHRGRNLHRRRRSTTCRTASSTAFPVSATYNLFNYINISPSANYNEKWYFKKVGAGMESRHQQRRYAAGAVRLLPSVQLQLQRLQTSTTVYGMLRRHQKTPRPQDSGDPPYDHAVDRDSHTPRTSAIPNTAMQSNVPDRFDRYVSSPYSPYSVNALRRPQFGTFDVDELLAVAEPRNEGAEQARHLGVKKIKLIDELRHQRFV